ncbi:O-antigen ligase domain-containing protein [Acinetobacter sp. ANC 4633]|uniref:O-antigen ligase family protein n=1 Tax=Acinetobacter sp. ANC 4633 TaxID=2529845 RepID=UPI00103AB0D0|nr:O-antigen ligase family protein [Acinetobacter sp. ANC 4633]TCB26335.1 O-antigen ligase domain-containing protein [Acinetobacter sp. ANC 4633]
MITLRHQDKNTISYCSIHACINLIFAYLLYKAVLGKSNLDGLMILAISIIASTFYYFKIKQKINFPLYSIFVFITPCIILSLQYFFQLIPESISVPKEIITIHQIFSMYNLNYTYGIFFFLIPFLIKNTNYNYKNMFNLITVFLIIYIIYNIYVGNQLNFNRDELANYFKTLITYDNISIILIGLIYLYSFYLYKTYNNKWLIFSVLIISLIAIIINITHGTRGTWLVLPFLFILTIWFYQKTCRPYLYAQVGLFIILSIFLFALKGKIILDRIIAAYHDLILFHAHSTEPTSIGSRLIMWKNAIIDFKNSPITGISTFRVSEQVCELSKKGIISGDCLTHMHSIYFQELASHGLIGFFALLFSFIFPLYYFLNFKANTPQQTLLKASGIYVIISTMICGITDYYFITAVASSIYYCLTLSLLALLHKRS